MKMNSSKEMGSYEQTKHAALLVATLSALFTPFMSSSVNIALPEIGKEFAFSAVSLSWVATSFLLAAAVFVIPFGRLADIYGRKRIFLWGIIVFTLAALLSAVANSQALLLFSRVLQGTGGAMIFGTGLAILTSVYPPEERGKVLGINVAAVYLSLAMGPFIGGLLTEHLGWRSIFWVNIPLGLLIIYVTITRLKEEWAEAKGEGFDYLGAFLNCYTFFAIIYGLSLLPEIQGVFLSLSGFLVLFCFIMWELKAKNPLLDMKLFRDNPVFAFSNLAALINYSATFAVSFILSLYLQYLKGLNPSEAGLVLISQPIIQAVFSPLAGKLSDRIEPRILASIGMGITFLGLFLLIFINSNTPLGYIVLSLIVLGFGFALFSSPNTNAVMSAVNRKYYGVSSAILGTMRLTGQMLSMGIIALVLALYMGDIPVASETKLLFLYCSKLSFIIFTILCFWGIFASLARGTNNVQSENPQI